MAQSNTFGTILTWGAIGVAAYFIYEWFFAAPSTAAATTATPTASTPAAAAPATTTPSAPSCNMPMVTLAQLQTMIQNAATAGMNAGDQAVTSSGGVLNANPDVFNYYMQEIQSQMPDCLTSSYGWPPNTTQVFPGVNRSAAMPFTTWWASMSAYLQGQGMSGLGDFVKAGRAWPEMSVTPWWPNSWFGKAA